MLTKIGLSKSDRRNWSLLIKIVAGRSEGSVWYDMTASARLADQHPSSVFIGRSERRITWRFPFPHTFFFASTKTARYRTITAPGARVFKVWRATALAPSKHPYKNYLLILKMKTNKSNHLPSHFMQLHISRYINLGECWDNVKT